MNVDRDVALRAASAFVRTVLVVDDLVLDRDRSAVTTARPPDDSVGHRHEDEHDGSGNEPVPPLNHPLDGDALTTACADLGIVCGLLAKPEPHRILSACRSADVLVIDWHLDGDKGVRTREVIKGLAEEHAGLRMVIVYTGEEPDVVDTSLIENLDAERREEGGLRVGGRLVVQVLRKGDESDPKRRSVAVDELPDEVLRHFAEATNGLIRPAALEAVGVLRANTDRLIDAFGEKLDQGYIGHRAAAGDKEEVADMVVGVIAAEITALLEDHRPIVDAVSAAAVAAWVADPARRWPDEVLVVGKPQPRMSSEAMVDWIEADHTDNDASQKVGGGHKGDWHPGPRLFSKGLVTPALFGAEAHLSDFAWSAALAQRRVYAEQHRRLTLGTVLERDDGCWFVCVQPVCDSVRVRESRPFLLVPARPIPKDKDPYNAEYDAVVCVDEGDGFAWRRLRWAGAEAFDVRAVSFIPDTDRLLVMASGPDYVVPSEEGDYSYRWRAQLTVTHAQRVLDETLRKLSRTGVDEAEWQRVRKGK